jgi:hypothetical protein
LGQGDGTGMQVEWQNLLSTLLGSSLAVGIAKHFLGNAINRLEALPEKLAEIKAQLSNVQEKLESLDKIQGTLQEHDRKILALEIKGASRVSPRRSDANCQA